MLQVKRKLDRKYEVRGARLNARASKPAAEQGFCFRNGRNTRDPKVSDELNDCLTVAIEDNGRRAGY